MVFNSTTLNPEPSTLNTLQPRCCSMVELPQLWVTPRQYDCTIGTGQGEHRHQGGVFSPVPLSWRGARGRRGRRVWGGGGVVEAGPVPRLRLTTRLRLTPRGAIDAALPSISASRQQRRRAAVRWLGSADREAAALALARCPSPSAAAAAAASGWHCSRCSS